METVHDTNRCEPRCQPYWCNVCGEMVSCKDVHELSDRLVCWSCILDEE